MFDKKSDFKLQHGSHAEIDLTSAAVQSFSFILEANARVTRLMARTTVAIVSSGSVVLNFRRRPVFGSSSGQSSLGTLTIPAAALVDKVYYKDITPVNCALGDQIVVEVTTASAGGGAAGKCLCDFEADLDPEYAPNQSNMIASA